MPHSLRCLNPKLKNNADYLLIKRKNELKANNVRITGWQWSAAELPVRVDAIVSNLSNF